MIAMGCKSQSVRHVDDRVKISGRLLYSPDGSPLWGGVINRASDGNAFMTDDSGNFVIEAQPGDSLHFSFVVTHWEDDPVAAEDSSMTVLLDPYVPAMMNMCSGRRAFILRWKYL